MEKHVNGYKNSWNPFQPQEYGEVLNVIDLLRSLGVGHYVQLPQLIVCGDQSSGKSSVLEAISRVKFPAKDTLCTRFATELILRRQETTNIDVKIHAGEHRSSEEIQQLASFKSPDTVDPQSFGSVVDSAKDHLDRLSGQAIFTEDVLRVEITGPDLPNVTLVDLPGLIHANTDKGSSSDVELVAKIVRRYMANERSIILAVVSAKNDFANQIVTTYAREADPTGRRSLGIITKPDDLSKGSNSEKAFLDLAKNKSAIFRLGWHALRNRDYESRDFTSDERDQQEARFFETAPWNTLVRKTVGIEALNSRLSKILNDHILSEMPSLISDMEREMTDSSATLARLGQARGTPAERKSYLVHIAQNFSLVMRAAIDGIYTSEFFGSPNDALGTQKRFRAVVQNTLLEFSEKMRTKGPAIRIIEDDAEPTLGKIPTEMRRNIFLENIRSLMRKTRGKELPGTFNPLIIGDLFFQQAEPWEQLLIKYMRKLLDVSREILELVAGYTADETTKEQLIRHVIDPAMEKCAANVEAKMHDVLRPHQKGHAITYNHYFTETVQKIRHEHERREQERRLRHYLAVRGPNSMLTHHNIETLIPKILDALEPPLGSDMELHACSEALDYMEAYYQVAMKVVIDDFAVLVIEKTLIEYLAGIFSPAVVMEFSDIKISDIASESEDAVFERDQAEKKLRSLQAGLDQLHRFRRLKQREVSDLKLVDGEANSFVHDHEGDTQEEENRKDLEPPSDHEGGIQEQENRTDLEPPSGVGKVQKHKDLYDHLFKQESDPILDGTWSDFKLSSPEARSSSKKKQTKKNKLPWIESEAKDGI